MDDYEIRDVMNRNKHPEIEIKLKFTGYDGDITHLDVYAFNKGTIYAEYITAFIDIPDDLLKEYTEEEYAHDHVRYTFKKDGIEYHRTNITNFKGNNYHPLLPRITNSLGTIRLHNNARNIISKLSNHLIYWIAYADNSKANQNSISIEDVWNT